MYDIVENRLDYVIGLRKDLYPARPIFDEHCIGIVFSAIRLEFKKLGLTFCLNRPAQLTYISDPIFDIKQEPASDYIKVLSTDFIALFPSFS